MIGTPTNPELIRLIRVLKKTANKTGAAIWRDLAQRLGRTRSKRVAVNLSRINRYSASGETILIPGKVLGAGVIDHPVKVAAFQFSQQARLKISKAKGKCLTIDELVEKNPRGSNIKVIG